MVAHSILTFDRRVVRTCQPMKNPGKFKYRPQIVILNFVAILVYEVFSREIVGVILNFKISASNLHLLGISLHWINI